MKEEKMIRVGINATALLSPRTGIGKYVFRLGKEFLASGEISPRFFYANHWSNELRQDPLPNIASIKTAIKKFVPHPYVVSRLATQAFFSAGLRKDPVDLYHDPNYLAYRFRGPTVITVHDLSWIRHPDTHPKDRLKVMDRYFPGSLERSSAIITDCEFVKDELVEVFGISPAKVHSVLLGVSSLFRPVASGECQETLAAHGLEYGRYFLSVGTLEPRKNVTTLNRCFFKTPTGNPEALSAGAGRMRGWLTSGIEAKMRPLVEKGVIKALGFVADAQMPMLYSGAAAFMFPSLYEGFGLPPLEAMACGAPVIVSNSSSIPEVVGDAGVSFDPMDVDGIAEAMRRMVDDAAWRVECSVKPSEGVNIFLATDRERNDRGLSSGIGCVMSRGMR
jgi:alpha-1,3-rhamnosyl/mannosyltransferase